MIRANLLYIPLKYVLKSKFLYWLFLSNIKILFKINSNYQSYMWYTVLKYKTPTNRPQIAKRILNKIAKAINVTFTESTSLAAC